MSLQQVNTLTDLAGTGPVDFPFGATLPDLSNGGNAGSGSYTPTAAAVTNVTTITAHKLYYNMIGSTVTVFGAVDVQASGSGDTEFTLTLPPGGAQPNFTSTIQLGGCGAAYQPGVGTPVLRIISLAPNKAQFDYGAINGTGITFFFSFSYNLSL